MKQFACLLALVGAGCVSQAEREAKDQAALAQEIARICALPAAERDAELERLKTQSGLVIVCGREKN